jgi:hypothetical protein
MIAVAVVAVLLGIGVDVVHRRERARQRQLAALITVFMQQRDDAIMRQIAEFAAATQGATTDPPPSPPK